MIRKKIDEILEQLKSNPGAAFGLLYPYILVIVVLIGLYYIGNIANVVQQNVPPLISEAIFLCLREQRERWGSSKPRPIALLVVWVVLLPRVHKLYHSP